MQTDCCAKNLCSLHVFACTGVHTDSVSLVDKDRHADLGAGLERCGLGHVGGRVAFDARLGLCDLETFTSMFSLTNLKLSPSLPALIGSCS